MAFLADMRIYHREAQHKANRLGLVIISPKSRALSAGNPLVTKKTGSSILVFVGHATCPVTLKEQSVMEGTE